LEDGEEIGVDGGGFHRGHRCGKPLWVFNVPFFSNLADSGPESACITIRSPLPCMTSTDTLIFFRSSANSVYEKATMPP
jgi:hypothetical protein